MKPILLIAFGSSTNPIGLYSIYDYLKRKKHNVFFLHLRRQTSIHDIYNALKPAFIGITCSTVTRHKLPEIIISARKTFPDAKIVLGGRHFQPDVLEMISELECLTADHIVIGDGEYAMEDIVNGIEKDHIIYGKPYEDHDFKQMDFPIADFMREHMIARPERKKPAILLSRGCIFNCHFCSERRKVLLPDPQRSAYYISYLKKNFGWQRLFLYDDIFGINQAWLNDFHKYMKKLQVNIELQVFVHGKTLTQEKLEQFIDIGVVKLSLGAESGDDEVLKTINKKATVNDYVKIHELVKKYGDKVKLHCLWMIGNMGETKTSLNATYRLSREIGTDGNPFFGYAIPYPGSVFWQKRKEYGQVLTYDWKHWNNREMVFVPNGLSKKQLRETYLKCRREK